MRGPNFDQFTYLATAARGTEPALLDELSALGIHQTRPVPGGIEFAASIDQAMRVCMWSRIANRVMLELGRDRINSDRQIYPATRALPLSGFFTPDHTIAVAVQARGEVLKNSMYGALVIKDAIVDFVRDASGRRPSVDRERPHVQVTMHLIDDRAIFYIELNGQPLNQRGYRVRDVRAPLKETLAAAQLRYARWDGRQPIWDPFCGSGTLLIEAAMIAADAAPGRLRPMGFETWPCFNEQLAPSWNRIRREAEERVKPKLRGVLLGSDTDPGALSSARTNARAAGLDGIVWRQQDASKLDPILGGALIVGNPPYGERLGEQQEAVAITRAFGMAYKQLEGHSLCLIGTQPILDAIGRKPSRSVRVSNGRIPCRFAFWQAKAAAQMPDVVERPAVDDDTLDDADGDDTDTDGFDIGDDAPSELVEND